MKPRRATVIGPYPPPVGGVSVHVQRWCRLLEQRMELRVLDPYGSRARNVPPWVESFGPVSLRSAVGVARALRAHQADVVHVHVAGMKRFAVAGHLLTAAVGRDAARILTIHSGRFVGDYQSGRASTRAIIRHVTRAFDGIVAVNDDIAAVVRGFGAPVPAVVVIPAYLPPPDPPDTRLAAELRAAADGGRFVLVTSGYGRRDYGFDVLVRAIASNRMLADRCELVLCTYGDRDAAYMAEVERLAESLPHVRHLRDLTPDEFAAVLQAGSAYIRATTLDGDAVAIREAGAFGRQVIASDAVTRPAGCLVFAAGSIQGLATSIIHAMEDRSIGVMQDLGRDGERRLFEFYEQIWDGKRRAAG